MNSRDSYLNNYKGNLSSVPTWNINFSREIINNLKIGLMYLSDYGYAAIPKHWNKSISFTSMYYPDKNGNYGTDYDYHSAVSDNWMYMGMNEFVNSLYVIKRSGTAEDDLFIEGYEDRYSSIRPSFYLQSWVLYSSGSGSQNDPYRIS